MGGSIPRDAVVSIEGGDVAEGLTISRDGALQTRLSKFECGLASLIRLGVKWRLARNTNQELEMSSDDARHHYTP